jgi:hypothetical protein
MPGFRAAWLGLACAVAMAAASASHAVPVTLSQDQLLSAQDATTIFGGNGEIVSRTADAGGVLFEIETSTIDFGKVALRLLLNGADLSAYDAYGLHFDLVSVPNPIVVTSYVQRNGASFAEAVSGDQEEGDSLDVVLALSGTGYDDVAYLGFQVFAAGGLEEPPAQTLLLRVSPLAGADAVVPLPTEPPPPVPEPGTLLLLGLSALALGGPRIRAARRGAPRPPL